MSSSLKGSITCVYGISALDHPKIKPINLTKFENPYTKEEMEQFTNFSSTTLQSVNAVNILTELIVGPIHCNKCGKPFDTKRGKASHQWRCRGPYKTENFIKRIPVPKLVIATEFIEKMIEERLLSRIRQLTYEWNYMLNQFMQENPSLP